ncbi:MAG: hypothetical protein MJ220_01670 [Bacilli bacterium]|nr:hypothetical protein [Bacilli bacterium]
MICLINKRYLPCVSSIVLAVKYKGWRTLVCYFDPFDKKVKIEKLWQLSNNYINRGFYLIGEDDNFVSNRGWFGYDWIINEIPTLFSKLKKFSADINSKANRLFEKHVMKDWYEIVDKKSSTSFLEASMHLHDSSIKAIKIKDNKTLVLVDTSWGNYVLIQAEDCLIDNVLDDDVYNDACIEFEDNKISIVMNKMFDDGSHDCIAKITASKVFWKIIISNKTDYGREEVLDDSIFD